MHRTRFTKKCSCPDRAAMRHRLRKNSLDRRSACPTALPVIDLLWWGRRFRLPIRSFEEFFRSLVSMRIPASGNPHADAWRLSGAWVHIQHVDLFAGSATACCA